MDEEPKTLNNNVEQNQTVKTRDKPLKQKHISKIIEVSPKRSNH